MDTRKSGSSSAAYASASAKTNRPSASVLLTSTLSPLRLGKTSCGRNALPATEFSTAGIRTRSCSGKLSDMIIYARPSTVAAPPISFFINPMDAEGLMSRPPVSKQTPLPTRVKRGPFVPQFISINRGARGEARPTAWISGKFSVSRSSPTTDWTRAPNF